MQGVTESRRNKIPIQVILNKKNNYVQAKFNRGSD